VATYVLIHGGGSSGWDWHLVGPELEARGHNVIAPDLPNEDESAGLWENADAVVEAVGDARELVVVGHSLGGLVAPLVCARVQADLLVLVNAMIPAPGENGIEWWSNTGYEDSGEENVFFHDVSPELEAEAKRHERGQSERSMVEPWPLDAWPDVPTRVLIARGDRMFTADFQRRVTRERLGIDPDEMDGGHYISVSRPKELAERLDAYWVERQSEKTADGP
jgi:pimeloyl-ACP methyl ester carboxylesterase